VYAGQNAVERATRRRNQLIEAALELLGTAATFSVTSVIARSGLAPRYFYDSFANLDELQHALYDTLIAEAERRSQAALARTGRRRARVRARAVLREMVAFALDDPRRGRVLFTVSMGSPVLGARREDEVRRFATLMSFHALAGEAQNGPSSRAVALAASFAMGGFVEIVSQALDDVANVDQEQLADDLTELFLGCARAGSQIG